METQTQSPPPVALWNPNAAALWSAVFTPVFGAYLQAANWRTLGDSEKADKAMNWFYAGVGMWILITVAALLHLDKTGLADWIPFVFLFVWYFASAKEQIKYVKIQYGDSYPRRSWTQPLLIGVGVLVGYIMVYALLSRIVWH
jgi:hypothetical protein